MLKKLHLAMLTAWVIGGVGHASERIRNPDAGAHFAPYESGELSSECKIYVSAYSHIYLIDDSPRAMGITLSIRNIDLDFPVVITAIDYYDTAGNMIDSVLETPHQLAPQATISYVVDQRDMEGGSGASFMVHWGIDPENPSSEPPLVEAVMAAITGNKALSFATRGVGLSDCDLVG